MHLQVTQVSGARLKEGEGRIKTVLRDIHRAVDDWRAMRGKMAAVVDELKTAAKGVNADEVEEIREFLRWCHDNQYTFLGFREYHYKGRGKKSRVTIDKKTGLGILRSPDLVVFKAIHEARSSTREVRKFIESPDLLMVTKTNLQSTIHRPVHLDAIGIKRLDKNGRVIGQRLFVGLFTSAAYSRSPSNIPLLRRRLEETVKRAGFPSGSHDSTNTALVWSSSS